MTHGRHIYAKSSDMLKAKMCAYPQSDHSLTHWKCVLRCCAKFPCVNIPDRVKHDQYYDITPSILLHIYLLILRCTAHGRIILNDKKVCFMCKHDSASEQYRKMYTRKELLMMETTIYNFPTSFYIPVIHKVGVSPSTCTNTSVESCQSVFKRCELFQYVLCCRNYSERLVASVYYKIKPEYYGGNRSVSIEGIS